MNAHFIVGMWGREFVSNFLEVSLPSQLAPGNLPAIASLGGSAYKIYTTEEDAPAIRAAPAFQRLSSLLPTEVLTPAARAPEGNKYSVLNDWHRRSIAAAAKEGRAQVFLSPDQILADGAFRTLERLSKTKRLVLVCAVRVAKEEFVEDLLASHPRGADGSLSVGPRELVAVAHRHPHAVSRSLYWGAPDFNVWPSHLYWDVPGSGWLVRAFHLHPLMVRPVRPEELPSSTVDDDYVRLACPDPEESLIVEDSDELATFEMTSRAYPAPVASAWGASPAGVACWAKVHANELHHGFVRHPIRIHSGELDGGWAEIERASGRTLDSIDSWLRLPAPVCRAALLAERAVRFARRQLDGGRGS